MEDTALDSGVRPAPGNGQQNTFLAITDNYSWSWYFLQYLLPSIAGLPASPVPANNSFRYSGNEADQAANTYAIKQDDWIDFTRP
jgi:hypothetical protein